MVKVLITMLLRTGRLPVLYFSLLAGVGCIHSVGINRLTLDRVEKGTLEFIAELDTDLHSIGFTTKFEYAVKTIDQLGPDEIPQLGETLHLRGKGIWPLLPELYEERGLRSSVEVFRDEFYARQRLLQDLDGLAFLLEGQGPPYRYRVILPIKRETNGGSYEIERGRTYVLFFRIIEGHGFLGISCAKMCQRVETRTITGLRISIPR